MEFSTVFARGENPRNFVKRHRRIFFFFFVFFFFVRPFCLSIIVKRANDVVVVLFHRRDVVGIGVAVFKTHGQRKGLYLSVRVVHVKVSSANQHSLVSSRNPPRFRPKVSPFSSFSYGTTNSPKLPNTSLANCSTARSSGCKRQHHSLRSLLLLVSVRKKFATSSKTIETSTPTNAWCIFHVPCLSPPPPPPPLPCHPHRKSKYRAPVRSCSNTVCFCVFAHLATSSSIGIPTVFATFETDLTQSGTGDCFPG